ncbi:MAG: recombinase family protein [Candidatus Marinimicrobia bacterium]|nr:recombinase family protein [Candidatus Neomarinimicrobiota bacterium]
MKRAFTYARVSTGEQAKGFSLEAQLDEIEVYCNNHEIEIISKNSDTLSGSKLTERLGLMTMLDQITNLKPDYIIATESDRISRNTFQLGWIDTHLSLQGVKLIFVNEKNADGPFGKAFQKIRAVFSEFETDLRQWRIDRGREKAKQNQRFMNRPPFGYQMNGKEIIPDPYDADIVNQIFNDYIKKVPIKRLARLYNKSPATIRYILRNRFYINPILNGKHTTILSTEQFQKAQIRLKRSHRNATHE